MPLLDANFNRKHLFNALQKFQGVVDKRSASNVLSHVMLSVGADGRVEMRATDYDVAVFVTMTAEVTSPGSLCLHGKAFFDMIKGIGADASVRIVGLDTHWAQLSSGRAKFNLAGIKPADFPDIITPNSSELESVCEMQAATLRDLLEKTEFSMSTDETRMMLNGVFFKLSKDNVIAVSTDGHRLSKAEVGFDSGKEFSAIVHKKGVVEVRKLIDGAEGPISILATKNGDTIVFRSGDTTYAVRQIIDNYPDFSRVIPSSAPYTISIDRDKLIASVRRVEFLANNKTYLVRVELAKDRLIISTMSPEYGDARDEIDIAYDGPPMVVGFNYHYLVDVLMVSKGVTINLGITDEFGPTKITVPAEPGATFVVMPMRA